MLILSKNMHEHNVSVFFKVAFLTNNLWMKYILGNENYRTSAVKRKTAKAGIGSKNIKLNLKKAKGKYGRITEENQVLLEK